MGAIKRDHKNRWNNRVSGMLGGDKMNLALAMLSLLKMELPAMYFQQL